MHYLNLITGSKQVLWKQFRFNLTLSKHTLKHNGILEPRITKLICVLLVVVINMLLCFCCTFQTRFICCTHCKVCSLNIHFLYKFQTLLDRFSVWNNYKVFPVNTLCLFMSVPHLCRDYLLHRLQVFPIISLCLLHFTDDLMYQLQGDNFMCFVSLYHYIWCIYRTAYSVHPLQGLVISHALFLYIWCTY